MPSYKAPLDDMRFVLNEVLDIAQLAKIKEFESLDKTTINQFLAEVAKLSEDILFPLNAVGDKEGCVHDRTAKTVRTPTGFKEAYHQFCQAGLPGFACDPKYGGLGMPIVLNTALAEMFCSANMAFGMYPGLSHGAYNAIYEYGSDAQKEAYLPKLVTGEWTGTMCLTEPQCGTDLGLIRTKAVRQADGSYQISGTKIFISAGEHDMSDNIIHLVLAKIDDPSTPPGIKGISLFLVPKFLDGQRNNAFCARIEEKMGIHGNSTCEMTFENARGFLIGEAHKGMKAMFVMMNEARLGVGLQGLGLSEVAYQNGLIYALDRKQGQPIEQKMSDDNLSKPPVAIIAHADVRRELLTAKAQTEGARMLAYWTALQLDLSHKHPDERARRKAKKYVDLLTPIIKAHLTDNAVDHTNAAIQVFGGHGYIKEHGMEQFNRDARITRLYEGTNGVQALDLVGRKVLKDNLVHGYMKLVWEDMIDAAKTGVSPLHLLRFARSAFGRLYWATLKMQACAALAQIIPGGMAKFSMNIGAVATPYLKLMSAVVLGHMWIKMAGEAQKRLAQNNDGRDFYAAKLKTAQFYFDHILPQARTYSRLIKRGHKALTSFTPEQFIHSQTTIGEK